MNSKGLLKAYRWRANFISKVKFQRILCQKRKYLIVVWVNFLNKKLNERNPNFLVLKKDFFAAPKLLYINLTLSRVLSLKHKRYR